MLDGMRNGKPRRWHIYIVQLSNYGASYYSDGITNFYTGGRSMMLKAGLRKEHISMVDLMNSHGGRSGASIMTEGDLFSNGSLLLNFFANLI